MASLSVNSVATLAWLFLAGASLATWLLLEDRAFSPQWTVSLVLAIAVLKVRVIVLHYMEIKHAPLGWRIAFELWPLIAAGLILGIWFYTGSTADCAAA
jgi:hypothetical protein